MNPFEYGQQLVKQALDFDEELATPETVAAAKYKRALRRINQRREAKELGVSAPEIEKKV